MGEVIPEVPCSDYCNDDYEDLPPCQCPVCKGFLKWISLEQPVCNKCGVELIVIPTLENGELQDYGKICAIGKPTKQPTRHKFNRLVKEGARKWRAFL